MRVWEGGDGPTVLAVHGLGGSGRYWNGLARRVGGRYRLVAPDLAGFGRSDKPAATYDRGFHLADLDAVVAERAGPGPVVVVGHSLGAVFAALWAASHVDDVSGLGLAAAPYPTGEGPPDWARRGPPAALRALGGVVRAAWPFVAVPIGVARGYPAALVMDFGRQRIHSRTRTMVSALWDPNVTAEVETIRSLSRTPTLLVNARDDRTVSLDAQQRWSELLPGAERCVLDEGGHQFPLRTGFAALAEWLDRLALETSG
jgi:pimeloyl-ACP methyl ester carboxylesterase